LLKIKELSWVRWHTPDILAIEVGKGKKGGRGTKGEGSDVGRGEGSIGGREGVKGGRGGRKEGREEGRKEERNLILVILFMLGFVNYNSM
jgi:hypothetical protein